MVLKIKIGHNFISSNYLTEILQNIESFQHANVFGDVVKRKRFFHRRIYIILTLKVNYKQVQNPKLTLNNLYENNLLKVIAFTAHVALYCSRPEHFKRHH